MHCIVSFLAFRLQLLNKLEFELSWVELRQGTIRRRGMREWETHVWRCWRWPWNPASCWRCRWPVVWTWCSLTTRRWTTTDDHSTCRAEHHSTAGRLAPAQTHQHRVLFTSRDITLYHGWSVCFRCLHCISFVCIRLIFSVFLHLSIIVF